MTALRLLLLFVACAVAPQVFADPFSCPQDGNPGYIGIDSVSVFLDLNPPHPDATQSIVFSVGKVAFLPDGLSTQVVGNTVNVYLAGHDDPAMPPAPTSCLATSVGPLAAGTYVVKVIVVPDDSDNGAPYVDAISSFDVQSAGANEPLPITGGMTSNWYDPAHSGEGIVVQIAAFPPNSDGSVSREFVFDWFTYDSNGNPFWISGNATIDPGDPTSVTVPAIFSVEGGFAGDFGAEATQVPWGTVTFSFPDPNHMTVDYASLPMFDAPPPPIPNGVPSGSGTLHYERLLNIDGLACNPNTTNCVQ
ncbi:MAG: hypothetical protein WBV61_02200 [Rhodanobacteraceae bacterium]